MKKYLHGIFLIGLLCLIVFAFFSWKKGTVKIDEKSYFLKFHSEEDVIHLKNELPVSDAIGKTFTGEGTEKGIQSYLEFQIIPSIPIEKEKKIHYEIYITKRREDTAFINDHYIKFYLTNEEDNPLKGFDEYHIPVYSELKYLRDKPSSKLLYAGTMLSSEKPKFKLRVWLADNYAIAENAEIFVSDIYVRIK